MLFWLIILSIVVLLIITNLIVEAMMIIVLGIDIFKYLIYLGLKRLDILNIH